ncbi:CHAT domain-containing protein [Amycolatopsis sp. NBC_01307]|uniref:CHAT domain-containing protein n=1 Tax=Amycolatopsis sp. NBC_01307 TaxID=2903561 RepID=UPI002E15B2F9|nr:CHAT domain-containing protein [Amycolatopsis sp. NBC_01307]
MNDRYLKIKELAEHAHDNPGGPNLWPRVQELAWRLIKDCVPRLGDDLQAAAVALATAKILLVVDLSARNWHRVVAIGWVMATAIGKIDLDNETRPRPGLLEAFARDLFRNAEMIAYAAHHAGVPAAAGAVAEQLTSIRLGDRMLHRSVSAVATEQSASALSQVLQTLSGQLSNARGAPTFAGEPDELDAFYSQQILADFQRIDHNRTGGARVALAGATGATLEAMRATGRSLVYLGGGVDDGVAIRFDAAAINVPQTRLATSIILHGADIKTIEKKVSELHAAATDRREGRITGLVLSQHIEQLLEWLGRTLWQPLLDRWPDLREQSLAIVPLGEVAQLPLYTALIDGRPVCAVLDLTIAPSARSLVLAAEAPVASGTVLVAADPSSGDNELPCVVTEAKAVADVHGVAPTIIGGVVVPGNDDNLRSATRQAFDVGAQASQELVERIRASAIVHLACHGMINPAEPLDSALLLGGSLPVSVILAEDLRPGALIVLSACDLAGIGTHTPGEQLGFPAVLLACGARSVVAALWPVPDTPRTVRLMTRFHEGLATMTATKALGSAIERARDHGAPATLWAPFSYFGA